MTFSAQEGGGYFALTVDSQGRVLLQGNGGADLLRWGEGIVGRTEGGESAGLSLPLLTGAGVVLAGDTGLSLVDMDSGALRPLAGEIPGGLFTGVQGLEGELLVCTQSAYVRLDPDSGRETELLNWNQGSLPGTGPDGACRLGEDDFVASVGEDYLYLTGLERVPYREKTPVKVAVLSDQWRSYESSLKALEQASPLYSYQVTGYTNAEAGRLLTELGAGDAPDLVLFENNLNTDSDYFEDLYPYIDADPGLSREDFLPNLLEDLSAGGPLRQLWGAVEVVTVAARSSDVGDGYGLTPEDYLRLVQEKDAYQALFLSYMDRENLLQWVAQVGAVRFTDRTAGTCDFTGGAFEQLLSWCAQMGGEIREGQAQPVDSLDQVPLSLETLSNASRVLGLRQQFGEPVCFVGFPTGEEGFSYYRPSDECWSMAIPTGAQNKEGAWATIKAQLELERQLRISHSFPVLYEAERRLSEGELSGQGELGRECLESLEDLFQNTRAAQLWSDEPLRELILELGRGFLNGDRSAHETAELIQSRVGVYMAEQYG